MKKQETSLSFQKRWPNTMENDLSPLAIKPGGHMEFITTEKKDHLYWIGLNRPKEHNRANVQMVQELSEAYTTMEDDDEVRVAIVYAHGKHFTLGLEFDTVMKRLRKEGRWPIPETNVNPWDAGFIGRPRTKPVIIAAHGFCFTLGIELMLASEINIAAPSTRFAQAEVKFGIFPIGGGTARWVQTAGRANGMRYLLTGEAFDATQAHRLGIIQEIVRKDQLMTRAEDFANMIADNAPLGIKATMQSVQLYESKGITDCAEALVPELIKLLDSDDVEEAIQAFGQQRKPVFKGK